MSTVTDMDKKRIREEVIEIMCNKLHNLPHPGDDDSFDYDHQALVPDITKDPLDIAEVSMDLDWLRPRLSGFWASGDRNPQDRFARGFDMIFDNPNFAGGGFSYFVFPA